MKKIIYILISLSALMTMLTMGADAANEYDYDKWNLLVSIDAVDDADFDDVAQENLSRSDYIIYLMRLFGRDREVYVGENLFGDLKTTDECYDAANIAKQMGCYPNAEFRPRQNITYSEAVEMLVKAMGYSIKLKSVPVMSLVHELDLPVLAMDKKMTINDMTELFYAAVHEPLLMFDSPPGTSATVEIDKGETILSKYYDIQIVEGIVTNNGITSIYSENKLPYGGIEIDEIYYGDSRELGKEYPGYKVRAYIDYTDDEDAGDVVYISNDGTEVVEINSSEIYSVNDRITQITYIPEGKSRTKTEKISENVKFIYNGKFYGDYVKADIMPQNGRVILIDNNSDQIADVVMVWSYETMFVDYVSVGSKTVYNAYKADGTLAELCLDEYKTDYDYEIYWDGDEITFSELQKYQVLSVAKSKNEVDGYMRIEVSKLQIKDRIEAVNKDDKELKINGKNYPMLNEFRKEYNNIKLSEVYVLYIDSFGNVAAMTLDDNETAYIYAYLFKAYLNDDAQTAGIRVFTQEADWMRYDVNDKVIYNGKSAEPSELLYGVKNDAKRSGLIAGGETNRQVIKLKTDGNNVVSVETALSGAGVDEFSKHSETVRYRMQDKSFDNRYFINENTVIFGIPNDSPENMDAYMLRPSLSADKQYDMTAYGIDEYGDAKVITVGVASLRKTIKTCLVIDIINGLNAEGDASVMLKCSFGNFGNFDIVINSELDYSNLNKGDIIDITINEIGEIISFTKKYNYASEAGKYYYPTSFHSDTYLYGRVVKIDPENERMIVNLGGDRTSQCLRLSYENLVVKKYNMKNRQSEIISTMSLEVGDYIVVDNRASYTYEIIVYEDL